MGLNIVRTASDLEVKNLINLGSSCMYPRNYKQPLNEDYILKGEFEPTNEGYAIAKVATQRLCQYISEENPEFKFKTLIPCNLYGRHDKFDPKKAHMVPGVIDRIYNTVKNNINTVEIWGDGLARREFLYAGDLADCLYQTIMNFDKVPGVMNVGAGEDHTINEYYQIIAEAV